MPTRDKGCCGAYDPGHGSVMQTITAFQLIPQIGEEARLATLIEDISATSRAPLVNPSHSSLSSPAAAYFVKFQTSHASWPNDRPAPYALTDNVTLRQFPEVSDLGDQSYQ